MLPAEGRFDDAAAYERSLNETKSARGEFGRALALLLAGQTDDAIAGYRRRG